MKKIFITLLVALSLCSLYGKAPKYIFLFIGDGMSVPQRMVAEEFAVKTGRGKLANHVVRMAAAVGTRGMAVEVSLEHLALFFLNQLRLVSTAAAACF